MLIRLSAVVACTLAVSAPGRVRAGYLVNPAGGTALNGSFTADGDPASPANTADGLAPVTLPFAFNLFGRPLDTPVYVGTDGNLNTAGAAGPVNGGLNQVFLGAALVSPLGLDLAVAPGSVVSAKQAGNAYAVTFDRIALAADPTTRFSFQTVFFGGPATVGGFAFQANDLVFAYDALGPTFGGDRAEVGFNSNAGFFGPSDSATVPIPDGYNPDAGNTVGLFTRVQADQLLPTGPGQFLLFRPGDGGYAGSVETLPPAAAPTPGPPTVLAGLIGLAGLVVRRRRS